LIEKIEGRLVDVDAQSVERAIEVVARGGRTELPHGLRLASDERLFSISNLLPPESTWKPTELKVPGKAQTEVGTIRAERFHGWEGEAERLLAVAGPLVAWCDADALGDRVLIRQRKPGDRLRPLHAPGGRKLQDILVDRKVHREIRDRLPVIEKDGQPVWVPGVALDDSVAANLGTSHVIRLLFEPLDAEYRAKMRG